MEVCKRDFALRGAFLSKSRDEQQISSIPASAVSRIGRFALFQDQVAQDAPENNDGKLLVLDLNEKDPPRLPADKRPKLMDPFDLGSVLRLKPQFLGCVLKGEVIEPVITAVRYRPVELLL